MTLWRDNAKSLRDSIRYLSSLGCESVKIAPISNTGAWREGGYQKEHGLTTEETLQFLYDYLEDFYRDLPLIRVQIAGCFSADGRKPDLFSIPLIMVARNPENSCMCGHARNVLYITPEGRALPCMPIANRDELEKEFPLIREIGVAACLSDSFYMKLITTKAKEVLSHNGKCRDCGWRRLCLGGCRAAALECHPGDIMGVDESSCEIFRKGWLQRIERRVRELRPSAVLQERTSLRELGREAELQAE